MPKVFVHTLGPGDSDWRNEGREFVQVPRVGEHFALSAQSPSWYRVELVVHVPYKAAYEAEVYAVEVSAREVVRHAHTASEQSLARGRQTAATDVGELAEGLGRANESLRRRRPE